MMIYPDYHIEMACTQLVKTGESVCGDFFDLIKIENEKRTLGVLSDGLGSGIKANILSGLTTTMALRFFTEEMDLGRAAELIMDTLPICEERKISYATFTAVDIRFGGQTRIVEMENPHFVHIRQNQIMDHKAEVIHSNNWPDRAIHSYAFKLVPQDRLVFCSDGVTQAGIGSDAWPFGWGEAALSEFIQKSVAADPEISAKKLSSVIVRKAQSLNPQGRCIDDISCAVAYFRKPRKMLLVSGPPFHKESDEALANLVDGFRGKKVICGGTTANIISRIRGLEVKTDLTQSMGTLPPVSYMDGVDLITEGILTLTALANYLEADNPAVPPLAVRELAAMLMESDVITFLIGTRVNEAHQDPNLPVDLEIRRNILKRLMTCLKEKYHKEVFHKYV